MMEKYHRLIEEAWENRAGLSPQAGGEVAEAIDYVLGLLDEGALRVAQKQDGVWHTSVFAKKALLLSFRLKECQLMGSGSHGEDTPFIIGSPAFDKIPLKCAGWSVEQFKAAGFRAVPGSVIRYSAFISKGAVVMPAFVNIGAFVGANTMVDTWVTIGSCAQVGANCHISGGVGIGGVLEPLQANPVIIEDNCFIGARSEIAEGVIVEEGCVISMGVFIGASTKIIHRQTGDIFYGRVPAYSVVVPGVVPVTDPSKPSLACAVIVKQVDERTRSKTSINDLLRV